MSFLLLHADASAALYADDPVVPAEDIARFGEAATLLAAATTLRDEALAAAATIEAEARARGHAQGLIDARAASDAALATELARLARADAERAGKQRTDLAALAIEVIRRVAGEVGTAEFVAGLAATAAAGVAGDRAATVRVHPGVLAVVAERLRGLDHVAVEADATLADTDCVVETALGRTVAGLDAQLDRLAKAWSTPA